MEFVAKFHINALKIFAYYSLMTLKGKGYFANSVFHKLDLSGREIYIKTDHKISAHFNGNKARKLYFLKDIKNKSLVSVGGNLSNMLEPLSYLAQKNNLKVTFFAPKFSDVRSKLANFKGVEIIQLEKEQLKELKAEDFKGSIFIPQGGACKEARCGVKILAQEIQEFCESKAKEFIVFLPSGTGTTALFLQEALKQKVYTTPLVGDADYLKAQMSLLQDNQAFFPTILDLDKKYHFGKLYKEFWQKYQDLKSKTNIEFDLLYDPKGWMIVEQFLQDKNIIYIHQGGLNGNKTMIERYKRKLKI